MWNWVSQFISDFFIKSVFKTSFSKKPAQKIFSPMAGKIEFEFNTKNSNSSRHWTKDFFGGFLRKIRL